MRYALHVERYRKLEIWMLALAVWFGLAGCASARQRVDDDIIRSVRFEGLGPRFVRPFSQAELRSAMSQKQSGMGVTTPGVTWAARLSTLDRARLDEDAARVQTWLIHHGHFDAFMNSWEIYERRPQVLSADGSVKRAAVVDVVGRVTLGQASVVRGFEVEWQDDTANRYARSALESFVLRRSFVSPGRTFDLGLLEYSLSAFRSYMQDVGYIHADADVKITAYPEEGVVDLVVVASTGPKTRVGEIQVVGNERVTSEQIMEVLRIDEGDDLTGEMLRLAQQRLISTSLFSLATVEIATDDPTLAVVPLKVQVKEAEFGVMRLGFGVEYNGANGNILTPSLRVAIDNNNVDRRLGRFSVDGEVGWGLPVKDGIPQLEGSQLLYGLDFGYVRPGVFGPKWDVASALGYHKDLLAGQLEYSKISFETSVSRRITDAITWKFGPSLDGVRLGTGTPFRQPTQSVFEEDRRIVAAAYGVDSSDGGLLNPILIPLVETSLQIDWRKEGDQGDKVLDPRGGYFYQFTLKQALPWNREAETFKFSEIFVESRFYRSILSKSRRDYPYTLSLRLRGKWLPGPADGYRRAIPYNERAFLGGSYDMRSFRVNQVGAYDCVCTLKDPGRPEQGYNVNFLPRGGRISGLVSGEVRRRWTSGRGLAVFGDVGMLAESGSQLVDPSRYRFGVGFGYRQQTPIGPVRIDLGFRPIYPEDGAPVRDDEADLGCYQNGVLIVDERASGLDLQPLNMPLIVNLSFAIGEAF